MTRLRQISALLLAGTALVSSPAIGQTTDGGTPPATTVPTTGPEATEPPAEGGPDMAGDTGATEDSPEISMPGGEGAEIVVQGRYIPEPVRNTAQVVSVLSAEEIARTGDGDIAGALQRVTGLSVNSSGFVYVRGLGDRYSLALLNGLALPSPEPLRRVVPLDVFPTSIVASAVVQKSYSVNYPGEFGGGVINLTTAALPDENFFQVGVGGSLDTETTAKLGYTYYGSKRDILGYDDGTRSFPGALRDNNGATISAKVLENQDTLILQRNSDIPGNFSASASGAFATDLGDARLGIFGSGGFSNGWRTRGATQQTAASGALFNHSYGVRTENRIQANALLGMGLDIAEHKLRFTNVYIHDTSKVARFRGQLQNLQLGFEDVTDATFDQPYNAIAYESSYVQRQLITSQLVGEFKFGDLELDLRGSYSNSQRNSPYERTTQYRLNSSTGGYSINLGSPSGVNFSELDEDVWAGGANIAYQLPGAFNAKLSAGYAYTDTVRIFDVRNFAFDDGGTPIANTPASYFAPFVIFSNTVIDFEQIGLRQSNRAFGQARYQGDLTVHAGYVRADAELAQGVRLEAGVRYESGDQSVTLIDLYGNSPSGGNVTIRKKDDYWLPAATLTWNFAENFQLRASGSKTIARPQFRELGPIPFLDVESDRQLGGNPFLTDTELFNAEARVEYYPGRGERLSVAGFYKRLDNPIETIATIDASGNIRLDTANAPKADLYGFEAEAVKFFPLDAFSDSDFFATKQLVLSANYTYSKSKLKVGADDTTTLFTGSILNPITPLASQVFIDGSPLTGQSEHLANLQFGIEDTERLQQLTVLFTYASERVVSRGVNTAGVVDPDIVEKPGISLDVVMRMGFEMVGTPLELKLEARNLTGTRFQETQNFDGYRVLNNVYDVGTTFAASLSAKF